MILIRCKKILCTAGTFLLCLSLIACGNQAPENTTTEESTEENTVTKEAPPVETYDYTMDEELLYKMDTWLGRGDSGSLTDRDSYTTIVIDEKKDLDPYRDYMYNLSAEDEERILADKNGKCILVELTGLTENTLYGTASITKLASSITVIVSVDQEGEPGPLHTYFLLYFPGEIYNGESIHIVF